MGFIWGTIHLVYTLSLSQVGVESSDWTFGQIIQVVLLAAPALTIVEFLYEGEFMFRSV